MELRQKRGLDAGAGLVVRPKPIAKRLDHVVGGDAEVRVAVLVFDYLENGLQHTDDRAVRTVLALGKPAQAVEVTEQFVGALNEMDDNFSVMLDLVAAGGKAIGTIKCQMLDANPDSEAKLKEPLAHLKPAWFELHS